jgi:hypothetical protein
LLIHCAEGKRPTLL